MSEFNIILSMVVLVLVGNLFRLYAITRADLLVLENPTERNLRIAAAALYTAIVCIVTYCACAYACDLYCPVRELLTK
jgi:hypothetical protein